LNCFHEHQPTFSVPCDLLEKGIIAQLSPPAVRLYLALCFVSQVRGAPLITLKAELLSLIRLTDEQLRTAGAELRRAELSIGPLDPDQSFHLMAKGTCLPPLKGKTARGLSTRVPPGSRQQGAPLMADQLIPEGGTNHGDNAS
jgi:hypothetical protein